MSIDDKEKLRAIYDALAESVLTMSDTEINEWRNVAKDDVLKMNESKNKVLALLKQKKKEECKKHRQTHDEKAQSFVSQVFSFPGTLQEKINLIKEKAVSMNLAVQFRELENISEEDANHLLETILNLEKEAASSPSEKKDDE